MFEESGRHGCLENYIFLKEKESLFLYRPLVENHCCLNGGRVGDLVDTSLDAFIPAQHESNFIKG